MQFKLSQPIFVYNYSVMNLKRIIASMSDEDSFIHTGQQKR